MIRPICTRRSPGKIKYPPFSSKTELFAASSAPDNKPFQVIIQLDEKFVLVTVLLFATIIALYFYGQSIKFGTDSSVQTISATLSAQLDLMFAEIDIKFAEIDIKFAEQDKSLQELKDIKTQILMVVGIINALGFTPLFGPIVIDKFKKFYSFCCSKRSP